MGYFEPVGSVKDGESFFDEITDVDGLSWQTFPNANHDNSLRSTLSRAGVLKSGARMMKKGSATKIETQTVYFFDQTTGYCGFVQFMNSNVLGGFHKSFEMNVKIFNVEKGQHPEDEKFVDYWKNVKLKKPSIFTPLEVSTTNVRFAFTPKSELAERGTDIGALSIEAYTDELEIQIDVSIGTGYKIKPDGRSFYSNTPIDGYPNVDRCIRHVFAPNCTGSGFITVNKKRIRLHKVPMLLISALQGLKPNSAAKMWNFATFMSPNRCIVCMEFTTPKDYGDQTVTIASDTDRVTSQHKIYCGTEKKHKHVKHFGLKKDPATGLEYPNVIEIPLPEPGGDLSSTLLIGPLNHINTFDILQEMPIVLKSIVEKIEGVNPQLYQFCQRAEVEDDHGIALVETTFISP